MDYQPFVDDRIISTESLGAGTSGSGTTLIRLSLEGGGDLVAKEATGKFSGLDLEGWMLGYLAEHADFPVPAVYHAEDRLLIMDYLPSGGLMSASCEEEVADAVAALHRVKAEQYGLERDTVIGPLPQPNAESDDWRAFFAEHRLLHMGRKALEEGRMDQGVLIRLERVCARLDDLIPDPAPPTLIHGDLWGGNVLCGSDGLSGFIDPAIYYADPEIELAFMTLFGTVGDRFFRRYGAHHAIRPGFFEIRRDLYNLYPLLVHVRLFGGGYLGQVQSILRRLT
ncbi:fructosamine kinase family protein [Parvularcula flava]|uniref:Aminoglycoside phosphotransferase n=1 Tax=Aquisalinus luteolus TaxID=1566827 RepID=A0A8J3EP26_9PROT|nr:fructosamine kinase family protein [Aquisalinus luteolus]NHK26889.1 fructosamine kinase family protein [Aquisalinus luteolus]GGH93722.1 aminoglycoside phosphotransferase [Aquisalinus luteolus]